MTANCQSSPSRQDLYGRITDRIAAALEEGVRPWNQPWAAGHAAGPVSRPLRHTLEPYKGVNVLLLWGEASVRGYAAPIWMTFHQALELGGWVRKGERGTTVVYADAIVRRDDTVDAHEDRERRIPFLKAYTVFNVEQIDGLPDRFHADAQVAPLPEAERLAQAEAFVSATGAELGHGGGQAFYSPGEDRIQMPPFASFEDAHGYYATLLHELTHWTRHETRLDRDFGRQRFGDAGYAREELVAELGAAFLCADFGVDLHPREDHASYIASWLKVLRDDRRFIFAAAAHAQRACDFLHGLQRAP